MTDRPTLTQAERAREPVVIVHSSVCGRHFDEACPSCQSAKESNDRRLLETERALSPALPVEVAEVVERLQSWSDGHAINWRDADLLVRKAATLLAALSSQRAEGIEAAELLRQAMNILAACADNDPNECIADNGMTVWDGLRTESERLWKRYRALNQDAG